MTERTGRSRLLGSRYELGELLGYGGMAEVFHGRDVRLSREVAVKMLRSDLARDASFQHRFRREAQAAASLNHPSIVAVYDTGEEFESDNGAPIAVPYIVMEYVEGRTLRDVMHLEGRLTVERALEIVADVCEALDYSHRAGIIHRDIKPGNVMLTPDGHVKVMDFGIARAVTDTSATMTQTAAVIGTAQYLSPEQARGEPVDARSDVYSTGILLYELLTGQPPFQGDSPVAVAYQHVREDPQPPSALDPDIPPDVDAVVMKALAKNPDNRYQSAGEMRDDLLRAASGRPVFATPLLLEEERTAMLAAPTPVLPPGAPTGRSRRGLTWLLVSFGAVVVIAVAILVVSMLLGGASKVAVPQVNGSSQAAAETAIRQAGLTVGDVTQQNSNRVPQGDVITSNPSQGTKVSKHTRIDLVVSAGKKTVTVPQLVGLSEAHAVQALKQQGLTVGATQQFTGPTTKDAGTVTGSSPKPGETVPVGQQVTLTVVSAQVQVPDVQGRGVNDASKLLASYGFTVVTQQQDSTGPSGIVLSQSLPPNSAQDRTSTITLTVSQHVSPTPTPPPTTPPPTTPPPTSPPPSSAPPSASPTPTHGAHGAPGAH